MLNGTLLLIFVLGYLIGTIPTAYWVVKRKAGLHIHQEGSGNVGAMNSFEVTGSKWTGVMVALLDAFKGMAAVWMGWQLGATMPAPWAAGVALFGAVAGHNFNIWLSLLAKKWTGGKGLATAAGGFLLFIPWAVIAWGILFFIGMYGFKVWRGILDSISGSVFATSLVPLATYGIYGLKPALLLFGITYILILPKHIKQMQELLRMEPA